MARDIFRVENPGYDSLRNNPSNYSQQADTPLTRSLPEDRVQSPRESDITDRAAVDGVAHAAQHTRDLAPSPTAEFPRIAARRPRVTRAAAPADAPAQTPDRAVEARAHAPKPRMVAVEALEETPSGGAEQPSNTKPDEKAVAQAARAGKPLQRVFSWIGGRVRVEATPEMAPPTARVREPGPDASSDTPDSEPKQSRFTWARIRGVLGTPPDSDKGAADEEGGARLQDVVDKNRKSDFSVGIVAEGVPTDENDRLIDATTAKLQNTGRSKLDPKAGERALKLEEELDTYTQGRNTSLNREAIAVGTADPAALEQVAEDTSRALTSRRPMKFEVERDREGNVQTYPDMESAVAAGGGPDIVVTAAETADHAELPPEPLPGLDRISSPTNFNVDHKVPDNVPKIAFAEILDNRGNPTGAPLEMTREHTAIFAETEAGKSVLLRKIAVEIQKQNFARREAALAAGEETWDHEGVTIIDCKNQNEFTETLSRELSGVTDDAGKPMPQDMATVHHYAPGGKGPGVRFNLLKPAGSSPEAWRKRVDTAVEIMTSKYKAMDPDTYRAVKTNLEKTLDKACNMMGINPATGRSRFPHGTPATPTGEFVASLVEEVAIEDGLKGDYRDNVVGWVKKEIGSLFRGDNGAPLSADGYDHDANAARDNMGVNSSDLANIRDEGARKVAVLAELYDMYDACVEQNRAEGIVGATDKIRHTVIVDEADIFGQDALGATLGDFFAHARHVGLRVVFATQDASAVNSKVLVNTPNKVMLRSSSQPDLAMFAGGAGKTTLEDMKHITGVPKGVLVYKGPNMDRAIRGRVPNPDDWPRGESYVTGPEALVDKGTDLELFDPAERAEARDILANDPLGLEISNWAETNTTFVASGRPIDDIGGELEIRLRAAINDPNPDEARKWRCVVSEAATNSVNSRPELQWKAPREDYMNHLKPHMLAIAEGKHLPGWDKPRPELALNVGIYIPGAPDDEKFDVIIDGTFGMAKDRLNEQMTTTPHPQTAQYEQLLGKKLIGETANEQHDVLIRHRIDTINRVAQVARASAEGQSPTPSSQAALADDVEKLVGGQAYVPEWGPPQQDGSYQSPQLTEQQEAEVRTKAYDYLRDSITTQNNNQLSAQEAAALRDIINEVPLDRLTKPAGYSTVEAELTARIDEYRDNAPTVNPKELAGLCGIKVDEKNPNSEYQAISQANTAAGQFEEIRKMEQKLVATVPYVGRIHPNRIFFSIDLLRPGATLDNNVAAQQALQHEDGPIYRARRAKSGKPGQVDFTAGGQLAQGDYTQWKNAFSEHVLYSDNFPDRSPAKTRYLVDRIGRITGQLWRDAMAEKAAA